MMDGHAARYFSTKIVILQWERFIPFDRVGKIDTRYSDLTEYEIGKLLEEEGMAIQGYFDEAVAWYKRRSVWAAGAVGVGVGFLLTWVF